jgi:8-oxo-dGTP diphosphatase
MAEKGKYIYEWPRPMVTADALVFGFDENDIKVLLIKRGSDPFAGKWAAPGGFIEMDEDLPVSAARELYEETGLSGIDLKELAVFGKPGRDPRGRLITVAFWGMCDLARFVTQTRAGDDAAAAEWFGITDVSKLDFAFDHRQIVELAILRLKETAEYKDFVLQQ